MFVLELPASQEKSLILDDLPTARRQHERETLVQCEEMGNQGARLRNKKPKCWNLERGRSEDIRKREIISFMGTPASC